MPTRTFTIPSKNLSFESHLTDAEAISNIRNANLPPASFGASLLRQHDEKRPYSQTQLAWVHKIALDSMVKKAEQTQVQTGPTDSYPNIKRLFTVAMETLKNPILRFELKRKDSDTTFPLRIRQTSEKSKYPGCMHVSQGGFGSEYYGRINADGTWVAGSATKNPEWPQVRELLQAFNADPARAAAEYGRQVGKCCFCGMDLTDERSIAVGYGPVCASNYSMPWGNEREPMPEIHIDMPTQPQDETVPA